ncbi:response regulator transcription factor [Collimonas humicola]|uniref:response regulator transcription factor n=1 Tax=Collimonas humicola TaxID=2825886 RepID=UPI001B8AD15E|nr:response regulator transcription factor [Collimonas humicola]
MNIACYIPSDKFSGMVQVALKGAGFQCERLPSGISLSRSVRRCNYDLILIELGAENAAREGIFSWMSCRFGESTPIVMLSSIRNADMTATALDAGADDFVSMPVEPVELLARVNAVLRRTNRRSTRRTIELAGFSMDREARTVSHHGTPIELTPREFTMAWLFFSTPGIYISRETIGNAIWGVASDIANRTIEQHVYKLRKKLQLGTARGVMLRTAYSQGYRLELCGKDDGQDLAA